MEKVENNMNINPASLKEATVEELTFAASKILDAIWHKTEAQVAHIAIEAVKHNLRVISLVTNG